MAEDKKDKNANTGNSLIKNLSNFYKRTFFTPPDADSELENISNIININIRERILTKFY